MNLLAIFVNFVDKGQMCLFQWKISGPYSSVDVTISKVFMMQDMEDLTLAEDICDTDYSRKCIGKFIKNVQYLF